MKIMDIFGALKKDMDFIEQQLYRSIDGDDGILSETSLHLLKAGGSGCGRCSCCSAASSATTICSSCNISPFRWS